MKMRKLWQGAIGLDAGTRGLQSYLTHPLRDEDLPGAKPEIRQKPLILQQYTAAYNLLNRAQPLVRSTESLRIQRIISPAQVSSEAKQTANATNRVIPSQP